MDTALSSWLMQDNTKSVSDSDYINGIWDTRRLLLCSSAIRLIMSEIIFTSEERDIICRKIQLYLHEELDQEVGQFDAGFLLDFVAKEIGAYFYNRGLHDAQGVLASRMENISEAIYEIKKPTQFLK